MIQPHLCQASILADYTEFNRILRNQFIKVWCTHARYQPDILRQYWHVAWQCCHLCDSKPGKLHNNAFWCLVWLRMTIEAKEGNWVGRATEKSITQLDGEADTHKSVAASPHFPRWEVYFFLRFEQLGVQTFSMMTMVSFKAKQEENYEYQEPKCQLNTLKSTIATIALFLDLSIMAKL